jgi:hypothetical protein
MGMEQTIKTPYGNFSELDIRKLYEKNFPDFHSQKFMDEIDSHSTWAVDLLSSWTPEQKMAIQYKLFLDLMAFHPEICLEQQWQFVLETLAFCALLTQHTGEDFDLRFIEFLDEGIQGLRDAGLNAAQKYIRERPQLNELAELCLRRFKAKSTSEILIKMFNMAQERSKQP